MRTRRGATFILTLTVLAGLVIVLAGAAATQRLTVKAALNRIEKRRARFVAEAGMQRAIVAFENQTPGVTTLQDEWATLGNAGADDFKLGHDSFRMEIVDACSKINLNTVDQTLLAKLPLTQEQIDSLLDWRSPGQIPRPQGAKDDYYNSLEVPYNTKLRRLDTFDELLQVKGFTVNTLYEPQNVSGSQIITSAEIILADLCEVDSVSRSVNPTGTALTNINTATLQVLRQRGLPNNVAIAIVARRTQGTFTSLGQVLALPNVTGQSIGIILDNFAVDAATTHPGRININTASADVLEALPGITPDIAQQIVGRQSQGFLSLAELLAIPGMNKQLMIPLADLLSVNSASFIVRIVGKAGGSTFTLEGLLQTDGTTPRFQRMTEPPYTSMTTRWGWSDPTNTITLGEAQ